MAEDDLLDDSDTKKILEMVKPQTNNPSNY